jgi:tetratricopeptide (TPR) repeat protein
LVEAEHLFRAVLAIESRHGDSLHWLGLIAFQNGEYEIAVEWISREILLRKDNPYCYYKMGTVLKTQGRVDRAVAYYERALVLKPDYTDAHLNLGFALQALGKPDAAMTHYEQALAADPNQPEAHVNVGNISKDRGDFDEAMTHYRLAIAVKPGLAEAYYNMGIVLMAQGRIDDAAAHYERAVFLKPDYANAHNNLSLALEDLGRIDAAMAHCERAIAINPDFAEAHNNLGNLLKYQGKLDEAMAHYGRALAIRPDYIEVHYNRAEIKNFERGDADLRMLEALCESEALCERDDLTPRGSSVRRAPHIHFALAKALDDGGDYARSFERLGQGNARKRSQIQYDEASVIDLFRRTSAIFDHGLFNRFQGEGNSSPVPVFVLGMPRSGSTLIEQILASHPLVHAAGERTDIARAARNLLSAGLPPLQYPEIIPALDGADLRQIAHAYLDSLPAIANEKIRIIDKAPGNFLYIGLIHLILPNARIIHTVRNPIDTCVSCYSKLFANGMEFSYDLAELGRYYRCYSGLMAHWRSVLPQDAILDVSYENVVDDLEREARRLIDFCGLPWDDRCIDFHKSTRPVKTASAVQVRKPIFRTSLQRWRRYEAGLAPLLNELKHVLPRAASA